MENFSNPSPVSPPEADAANWFDRLPDSAFLRQAQLLGNRKRGVPGVVPISSATVRRMVKAGTFPKPTKLSARVTAWEVGSIRQWLAAQRRRA